MKREALRMEVEVEVERDDFAELDIDHRRIMAACGVVEQRLEEFALFLGGEGFHILAAAGADERADDGELVFKRGFHPGLAELRDLRAARVFSSG